MKKKNLKLGLKKVSISNLSKIKGGNESKVVTCQNTVSRNFDDLCCPVFGTEECPDTEVTTCHSGHPGCDDPGDPNTDICALTFGSPCI